MDDPELIDDLTAAMKGVLERELRVVASVDEPRAESDLVHTHRFPAAAVSFEPLLEMMLRAVGALEEPGFDKTRWLFHFMVSGQRCRLRWTSGGIRLDLYAPLATDKSPEETGAGIERRLVSAAQQIYRRVVAPRVDDKMKTGDVTVINQYRRYRGMVDFYIREIQRAPGQFAPPPPEPTEDPAVEIVRDLTRAVFEPLQRAVEQAYRATALVAGYFSWVQHLLVTLTAFSPRALEDDFSLDELLAAPWRDQFDQAYPSRHDTVTARLKSDLWSLAKDFRNPLLHGGGGRYEDGVVVEWAPGQQIVAVAPDAASDLYMLWQPSLSADQVDDLIARIARIDEGFAAHPFFDWVASGMPADFNRAHVRRALRVVETGTVAEYTSRASDAYDDVINWDA